MANLKDLLVSGASRLLSTLRVSGDTHIDGTLYLNGQIGSNTQAVYVNSSGVITPATGTLANSISGNAATASAVKDYNNGSLTTFGYSTAGMSSTSWLGSWDGYKLRAISPANAIKSGVGTTAIGSTSQPIYWNGSSFVAITGSDTKHYLRGDFVWADEYMGNLYQAYAYPYGKSTTPYYKVATFTQSVASTQINTLITFYVSSFYSPQAKGILEICCRWEGGNTTPNWVYNRWLVADERINKNNFIATWICDASKNVTLNLYVKVTGWADYNLVRIAEHNWGNPEYKWTLNKITGENGLTTLPAEETQIISVFDIINNNAVTATQLSTTGGTSKFWRGDNTWSDTISGGTLKITNNSNTFTIGSQNSAFNHLYNSANIPFIFNNSVLTTTGNLGNTDYPFNNLYIGKTGEKGIYYVGTKATNKMITFVDNTSDSYGNGIKIGGGGVTVVGSGESSNISVTGGSEVLYLLSDETINIEANASTLANRIGFQVTTAGHLIPVKAEATNNLLQDIGTSSNRLRNIYANALDLSGDASNPSATAGARIIFSYTSGQPVYISYTPNDSYRAPAGLKVFGGASANPAWFETEGSFYATGTSTGQSYYLHSSNIEYARLFVSTKGVAGTATTYTNPDNSSQTKTGYTGNVTGVSILSIGNNRAAGSNGSSYASPGTAGTADNAQGYLRLYDSGTTYGEITGFGNYIYATKGFAIPADRIGIDFRPGLTSYRTYCSHQTMGNEALVFATTQGVTSFIFVNGESSSNISSSRWNSLTPGLQIKQNCVSIGKLIANNVTPTYKLEVSGGIACFNNGLEVKGHIAGDTGTTGHGLYGGGGYHSAYNNIILHGDSSTGTSGIAFISDKATETTGAITNINQYTDRGFIQFHACGVTTYTSEGTNPTLATSGEANKLIIGVGNDADDQVRLQTPSRTGLLHQVGASAYVIPDTNNTTGNMGSSIKPVYITGGYFAETSYSLNATINGGTASRIAYYSGANAISSGSIVTDGGYLGSVSYLSVNTAHQTSYRAYINGSSYLVGETVHGANVRSDTTRTDYLGTSSYYWKGAYIWGDGAVHPGVLLSDANWGASLTKNQYYGYAGPLGRWYASGCHGSMLYGMPAEAITVEYCTNGSNWAVKTAANATDGNKRNFTNMNECWFGVGNKTPNFDAGSGNNAAPAVGWGVRITLDLAIENRCGWINTIMYYTRIYAHTCRVILEVYNKQNNAWYNLEDITLTNSNQWRQVFLNNSYYMNGNNSNTSTLYINKIRMSCVITTINDNSNKRYLPGFASVTAFGLTSLNLTSNATYKHSTRFAWSMSRYNNPIFVNDPNNTGLGASRISTADVYIGDDMRYTAANTEKWSTLILGNSNRTDAENTHSRGRILLYSDYTGYHYLQSSASNTGGYTATLAKATGWIAIGGNGSSTGVGSASQPVYMNSSGQLVAGNTIPSTGNFVQKSGDTMTGALTVKGWRGTVNVDYGETLPSSPSVGQIFFQYGPTIMHELPQGGPVGYVLVKNTTADYDVKWGTIFSPNTSTKYYVAGPSTTSATGVALFNTNVFVQNNVLYGAAWNDYAEYRERKGKYVSPGRCVVENGDGSLSQSTKRLQPGAEIVSDTFGFAIGKTNKCKLPIAVSGRVLAYPYEDINTYKIGAPVCSGPNGTVSQMTDEEARLYPWLIIGTVSSIPTEKTWGANNVKINGRIWIRVR